MPGERVHVVVGVVFNDHGHILLSRRPAHVHQGDMWEFPGGKLEAGETSLQALKRELEEELGIIPVVQRPLIRLCHDYPDKSVFLDVWRVERFQGQEYNLKDIGCEGQEVRWVVPDDLSDYCFPTANQPIIMAARLPGQYLITPEPGSDNNGFLHQIRQALGSGIKLLRLRAWSLETEQYLALAGNVVALCHRSQARVMLSGQLPQILEIQRRVSADGLHLSRHQLKQLRHRPIANDLWLAASCHDFQELEMAQSIGADFVTLSPVLPTPSHPGAWSLGWVQFRALCDRTSIPIYAFGGVAADQLALACERGAQGVAGIRAYWPDIK